MPGGTREERRKREKRKYSFKGPPPIQPKKKIFTPFSRKLDGRKRRRMKVSLGTNHPTTTTVAGLWSESVFSFCGTSPPPPLFFLFLAACPDPPSLEEEGLPPLKNPCLCLFLHIPFSSLSGRLRRRGRKFIAVGEGRRGKGEISTTFVFFPTHNVIVGFLLSQQSPFD